MRQSEQFTSSTQPIALISIIAMPSEWKVVSVHLTSGTPVRDYCGVLAIVQITEVGELEIGNFRFSQWFVSRTIG